jgi:hypothetical protein
MLDWMGNGDESRYTSSDALYLSSLSAFNEVKRQFASPR